MSECNLIEYLHTTTEETVKKKIKETVYLPLYGRNKKVPEKSQLNHWNAAGRQRHPEEVYIHIPMVIHKTFPDFFPGRDQYFRLKFPDGEIVEASVCQDNDKALMTKSNASPSPRGAESLSQSTASELVARMLAGAKR